MSKGQETRDRILLQALHQASEVGLEGLTVGDLAGRVGMSKSGLYAHFASKEDLQCRVLDTAADQFVDLVVAPALKEPRGLPRIRALFARWLDWATRQLSGGCPFVAAAVEFDDRPGAVRDRLVSHLKDVLGTIARAASISVEEGHFREDMDPDQFAFEFWGILQAFHHYARLFRHEDARARADAAFEVLVAGAART
jgi:AcrR family transcriptional regulator